MKIKVIIERGTDGTYGAYMDDNSLTFGLLGDGKTVKEAIDDFYNSAEEMKEYYKGEGKEFPDIEFEFVYDLSSFLQYYSKILSLAGLERLTGVNQGQLSHYITGRRKPGRKTTEKIEKALHQFGNEISQVEFI
jgi:predicted RNase H-like HicB family nuclease